MTRSQRARSRARHSGLIWMIDALVAIGLVGAIFIGSTVLDGGKLPASASGSPRQARSLAASATTSTSSPAPTTVPTTDAPIATVTEPAPTTTAPLLMFRAPLTGTRIDEATATALATRRAIAVKIDDASQVLTHPGLEQADVVFELLVEGGLTRYLAVYQSRMPDRVGPVRSVRTSDFSIVTALNTPVLVFSGGNPRTVADVMRLPLIAFPPDAADRGVFVRDSGIKAPHNLFVSIDAVGRRVVGAANPKPMFANPRTDAASPGGEPTPGVQLRFSASTDSSFVWDRGRGQWLRFQRGARQLDGGGTQLGFENVVTIFTTYGVSPYDSHSPEAVSVGSGLALLMAADGTTRQLIWTRANGFEPFTLTTPEGAPVDLAAGRTWVAMVGGTPGSASVIGAERAASMLAAG